MFIIFGTKNVGKVLKTGTFHCSRCNAERTYELKNYRKYFSLFFLPVIPLGDIEDSLDCTFCKTSYVPQSVLSPSEYQTKPSVNTENPLASAGSRLGAYIVDMVILLLLNFPLAFLIKYLPEYFNDKFYLVFIPLWIVYFFLMEVFFKGTIGKKIFNIETVSEDKNADVSVLHYFLRSIFKSIPIINVILLFNEKRKGVHDIIAKTIVVRKIKP